MTNNHTSQDIIEKYGQQYHEMVWMPLVRQLDRIEKGVRGCCAATETCCAWQY